MLPLTLSDTASTSQDGSSLEFLAAIVGRQCYIQDASGRGLWLCNANCAKKSKSQMISKMSSSLATILWTVRLLEFHM